MAEPNFRPWTKTHSVYLALATVSVGLAWWYLPRVSWLSDFFRPVLPSPALVWKVRESELHGRALAVSADDGESIYVVGDVLAQRSSPAGFDRSFIARYRGDGSRVWNRVLDDRMHGDRAVFHDVTTTSDGEVCGLSHHYSSFDNARVRCFDAAGAPTADHALNAPRSTRLLALSEGSLVLGASQLVSFVAGLPFSRAWLGELRGGRLGWTAQRSGKSGTHSEVVALAGGSAGEIYAGGFLGRGPHVSQPWLAKWSANGKLIWSEVIPCHAWAHQSVVDVTATASGDVLVAGFCDFPWVRRYDEGGRLRGEHRFAASDYPRTLYATEHGYVVGSSENADQWGQFGTAWKIRGVSAAGFPLWTIRRGGCQVLRQIRPTRSGDVVVLGFCKRSMVIAKFARPR